MQYLYIRVSVHLLSTVVVMEIPEHRKADCIKLSISSNNQHYAIGSKLSLTDISLFQIKDKIKTVLVDVKIKLRGEVDTANDARDANLIQHHMRE